MKQTEIWLNRKIKKVIGLVKDELGGQIMNKI